MKKIKVEYRKDKKGEWYATVSRGSRQVWRTGDGYKRIGGARLAVIMIAGCWRKVQETKLNNDHWIVIYES